MAFRLFVRRLSRQEAAALARLLRKSRNPRELHRARAVRLSNLGHRCPEIARRLGVSVPTVTRTLNRFNREGLPGLTERPRSGRPAKVSKRYVELLRRTAASAPHKFGYPFAFWTRLHLCEHLRRRTGITVCPVHLSRLMSKHGISHRRPRKR